jgi:hypothetical protein
MKLSIIPEDRAIVKDGAGLVFSNNLNDYITSSIPLDIHALQWSSSAGEVEYIEHGRANEPISELPAWAYECVSLHETTLAELAETDSPEASE